MKQRVADVQTDLAAAGVDVLLVNGAANVRYLTGFSGSNGIAVLPRKGIPTLVTDARYAEQATAECPDCEVAVDRGTLTRSAQVARDHATSGGDVVGFESQHVTHADWLRLSEAFAGKALNPTSSLVERRRRVKDADELQMIVAACEIAEAGLTETLESVGVGTTQRELALGLERAMQSGGADERGFPTIVASGSDSAIPHHAPTDRRFESGDLLKIDFGAKLDGYHSDITRCFVVGAAPSREQDAWHAAVLAAQQAACAVLRPGVSTADLYAAARDSLAEADLAQAFIHGLGHGVGLEIHETPIITTTATETLEAGEVVTIEPGVYFPGVGGIRIEDTLVVTTDGYRSLTSLPRELIRVG